jgi:SAM-dependent methyltransferase
MSESRPNRQQILEMMNGFRAACVIGAAAELDLWTALGGQSLLAEQLAKKLHTDLRATTILLDAVATLGLVEKRDIHYSVPSDLRGWLVEDSPETILPMLRHAMTILRSWSQLAWVTKSGFPAPRIASIRGPEADRASFIAAMHVVSGPMADELVQKLGPPKFRHLLDVGGASGTWTLAFLRAVPDATATIFDLPDAIEQARHRLTGTEFADRVTLVAGDFYADDLPEGADFAWVSAICHQHSRRHNRELFGKVFRALAPGGRIALRDVVMEPNRSGPREGALFAVNMLVNTDSGDTFTFDEYVEDLKSAGFDNPQLQIKHEAMNSVIAAEKP